MDEKSPTPNFRDWRGFADGPLTMPPELEAKAQAHLQRVAELLKERYSSSPWHQARAASWPDYWLREAMGAVNIIPGWPYKDGWDYPTT